MADVDEFLAHYGAVVQQQSNSDYLRQMNRQTQMPVNHQYNNQYAHFHAHAFVTSSWKTFFEFVF